MDAAERLFGAYGYHDVSLARIAAEVGITVPSITYYFPTKQALFDEVLRAAWSGLADAIRPALATTDDSQHLLSQLLVAIASFTSRHAALFTTISTALLSQQGLGADTVNDTLLPLADEIERALRARADPSIHADAPLHETLLYIATGLAGRHVLHRDFPAIAESIQDQELFLMASLLNAAISWTPDSPGALISRLTGPAD